MRRITTGIHGVAVAAVIACSFCFPNAVEESSVRFGGGGRESSPPFLFNWSSHSFDGDEESMAIRLHISYWRIDIGAMNRILTL